MKEKRSIQNHSVEKLFLIIETMARASIPLRLQEVADAAAIPASTALRFLNTLRSLGYVYQDPSSLRYSLTLKFAVIGDHVASQIPIRDIARPFLAELSRKCEETCCLAEEQDMETVYLDVVEQQDNLLRVFQRPGVHAPLHCTGVGKLFLLNRSESELDLFLRLKKLDRMTPNTITTYSGLADELGRIRRQGFAMDNEENASGLTCIAAPIRDHTGRIRFGISIAGPSARLTEERVATIVPYLLEAAEQITETLGTRE